MITSGAISSLKIAIVYWLSVASPTYLKLQNALKELQKRTNKDPVISSPSLQHCQESTCSQKMEKAITSSSRATKFCSQTAAVPVSIDSPAILCNLLAPAGNFELVTFATRFNQLVFLGCDIQLEALFQCWENFRHFTVKHLSWSILLLVSLPLPLEGAISEGWSLALKDSC